MRIIPVIIFVFLKVIFINTSCFKPCDTSVFKEVCCLRPNCDTQVVVKNMCLAERQKCYDDEFNTATYTILNDGPCKGWDGWTYEDVGKKPSFA